ncbi:MAG: ATP-binding protein, partial [Psychrosphaera sp.]|nr:ATP-binding protein [Psychrosphaera sp.]
SQGGKILLGGRHRVDGIELQVLDNGAGIDETMLEKLLGPFQQSGKHLSEMAGYGLGMYIIKTLCDQSNYQLRITSTLGKGSCFGIFIGNPHN